MMLAGSKKSTVIITFLLAFILSLFVSQLPIYYNNWPINEKEEHLEIEYRIDINPTNQSANYTIWIPAIVNFDGTHFDEDLSIVQTEGETVISFNTTEEGLSYRIIGSSKTRFVLTSIYFRKTGDLTKDLTYLSMIKGENPITNFYYGHSRYSHIFLNTTDDNPIHVNLSFTMVKDEITARMDGCVLIDTVVTGCGKHEVVIFADMILLDML